jgi:hypothetical protein
LSVARYFWFTPTSSPEIGLGDHAAINGFDFRQLPTHHSDSGAARDLLRADGVRRKVGRLDRTAALDIVLRAYIVKVCSIGQHGRQDRLLKIEPMDV